MLRPVRERVAKTCDHVTGTHPRCYSCLLEVYDAELRTILHLSGPYAPSACTPMSLLDQIHEVAAAALAPPPKAPNGVKSA